MDLEVFMIVLFLFLLPLFILYRARENSRRLPPGSLGLPFMGQNLDFTKALKADKVNEWFHERISKHGPVWKAHLLGYRTVVLHGTAANKFVFTNESNAFTYKQPPSIRKILGKTIKEVTGDDHKRVRGALVSFLKLEVLKQYVMKVDEEVKNHLQTHWHAKNEIQVRTQFRSLTFNVICSLLFGIERGHKREQLLPLFQDMMSSLLAVPVNFPFTQFNRGLKARKKLVTLLMDLLQEKREALKEQNQEANPPKDLITSLLNIHDDTSSKKMLDEEIIDNIIFVMIAGYDTEAGLLAFLVRLLANNELIYSNIAREQEEISKSKEPREALTWEDLTKMKYTWRVASEALRISPPANLVIRQTAKEVEYGGYIIPKGWQVILSPYMTHMDDGIFQNPTMFDPSRFERHASSPSPPPPPFSFVPFGGGARMCPGIELVKMETLTTIHYLVIQFKWELLNKEESFRRVHLFDPDYDFSIRTKPFNK